jgi:peptidoglycan biosynthesis protein MviN/MurJ (putative lipid II flippase)
VFWFAAKKNEKITFAKKWAPPIVAFVFAVLNTAIYWLLVPVLDIATLGAIGFAMPFIVNALLLAATVRILQSRDWSREWFKIQGVFASLWMATFLTVAHGVLWFALDYLPKHV